MVGDDAETLLAFLQGDFGLPLAADVAEGNDRTFDCPITDYRSGCQGNREKAFVAVYEMVEIGLEGFTRPDGLVDEAQGDRQG